MKTDKKLKRVLVIAIVAWKQLIRATQEQLPRSEATWQSHESGANFGDCRGTQGADPRASLAMTTIFKSELCC